MKIENLIPNKTLLRNRLRILSWTAEATWNKMENLFDRTFSLNPLDCSIKKLSRNRDIKFDSSLWRIKKTKKKTKEYINAYFVNKNKFKRKVNLCFLPSFLPSEKPQKSKNWCCEIGGEIVGDEKKGTKRKLSVTSSSALNNRSETKLVGGTKR